MLVTSLHCRKIIAKNVEAHRHSGKAYEDLDSTVDFLLTNDIICKCSEIKK